jgi:adenosylmethionine-8-amino-7-oxononanoate aminotransferase
MRDWLEHEPIIISSGQGAVLRDVQGREYLDANSSIWTNLHGHRHPRIDAAIRKQLRKIAHSSALGLANEPASLLGQRLILAANPPARPRRGSGQSLAKVFFSDDGATAMEVALKLAYEYARRARGLRAPKFLSLAGAYHGDTVGAVSLGHIDLFHRAYSGLMFKSDRVMAPYCYRCAFNRAKPERADARQYRRCHWECVDKVEAAFARQRKRGRPYAAFVVEPLVQGAAGMIPQPPGWLARVAEIVRRHDALLIADEVLTGFGRTTMPDEVPGPSADAAPPSAAATSRIASGAPSGLCACHHEGVRPDLLAFAKGLSGGYLPIAATLSRQAVFDVFLGGYDEFKTFFHGHSFTGNQLGAAAALASLDLLESPASLRARRRLATCLREQLSSLWDLEQVGDIRQVGLIAGIELVKDSKRRTPFDLRQQAGIRVCQAMAKRGVLTRPIGNVVVIMPPYCTTPAQAWRIVSALREAVRETIV